MYSSHQFVLSRLLRHILTFQVVGGRFDERHVAAPGAIAISGQKVGGVTRITVAADRVALAGLLDPLGRQDEAESLLRESVPVLERTVGRDHVDVAAALNNLAAICQRRGLIDEAEHYYRRALSIKEHHNGPDHPELTPTLNNLAMLLDERGQLAESARLYQRAFAILEGTVESNHPNLVACCANYQKSACCLR